MTKRNVKTIAAKSPLTKSLEDILRSAVAYKGLQEEAAKIDSQLKELKSELSQYVEENGVVLPNRSKLVTDNFAGRAITLKMEARNSTQYVVNAGDILKKSLSKELKEKVFETIEVMREDVIELLVGSGEIPIETVEKITSVSTSYAFKITVK